MRSRSIVEGEVAANRTPGLGDTCVGVQVNLLIFYRAPKPFHKDVVAPCALAVYYRQGIAQRCPERHADGDLGILQHLREVETGELGALIAVEDIRFAMEAKRLLQCLDAEVRCQRDRYSPCQGPAAEPIDDGGQIDEAARHPLPGRRLRSNLPRGGMEVMSVAQTWLGRVTARFRSR